LRGFFIDIMDEPNWISWLILILLVVLNLFKLKKETLTPRTIPTKVSVGKCTPSTTRENPTKAAHKSKGSINKGIKNPVIVATINAADVCPEGKLN